MNQSPGSRFGSAIVTLPTDTQIQITRVFDAPAIVIFEAWTTPELVRRWWGSEEHPLTVCDIDLRVGGGWRYAMVMDGTELGWHGTYQSIDAPDRLVSTEVFEGFPDGEAVNTLTLDQTDGTTTLTVIVQHQTRENRDGHIASGMEAGMQRTLDMLDTLAVEQSRPIANRWRTIAATFTERAQAVPPDAWANPSPCAGWTARDIVAHLLEWVPPFLESGAGLTIDAIPPVATDPVAAWLRLSDRIQAILDDDNVSDRVFDHPMAGRHPLDQAIDRFILGDVLIHTWDLSRATGQNEALDPPTVNSMLEGLAAFGDALQQSGQYGAKVAVADDADHQTRLLALTGRRA